MSSNVFSALHTHLYKVGGIFFDLDGTLILNNEEQAHKRITTAIYEAAAEKFGRLGVALCEYDVDPTHRLAGTPIPAIIDKYSWYLGVEIPHQPVIEKIMQQRKKTPTDHEEIIVHKVFRDLLGMLQEHGIPRAIVTSSETDRALRYVEKADLSSSFEPFDPYIFSGHKPAPDPYLDAWLHLRKNGYETLDTARCIGFEDTPSGIMSCKGAGMVAIGHLMATHVRDKGKLEKDLRAAGADYIIPNSREFFGVFLTAVQNLNGQGTCQRAVRPAGGNGRIAAHCIESFSK